MQKSQIISETDSRGTSDRNQCSYF